VVHAGYALLCYAVLSRPLVGNHEIYTRRSSPTLYSSPSVGSLTHPSSSPTFLLISNSRSRPYTLPFGSTTGSFSTWLLVWWAYGSLRASSFSSVEQIGQTVVVEELAFAVLLANSEWQEGVFKEERPAERAMRRRG